MPPAAELEQSFCSTTATVPIPSPTPVESCSTMKQGTLRLKENALLSSSPSTGLISISAVRSLFQRWITSLCCIYLPSRGRMIDCFVGLCLFKPINSESFMWQERIIWALTYLAGLVNFSCNLLPADSCLGGRVRDSNSQPPYDLLALLTTVCRPRYSMPCRPCYPRRPRSSQPALFRPPGSSTSGFSEATLRPWLARPGRHQPQLTVNTPHLLHFTLVLCLTGIVSLPGLLCCLSPGRYYLPVHHCCLPATLLLKNFTSPVVC